MITVIDYKAGNLTSVMKALDALGCQATVTADPEVVQGQRRSSCPAWGISKLPNCWRRPGSRPQYSDAIAQGIPFLGICVGLQWLFEGSTEAPAVKGLSLFPWRVRAVCPWGKGSARGLE